ncbi:hypothetical protein ES705_35951 [subsurface metagenome]
MATATREPTERSNPPLIITKACPKAIIPKTLAREITIIKLVGRINNPLVITIAIITTIVNIKIRSYFCK